MLSSYRLPARAIALLIMLALLLPAGVAASPEDQQKTYLPLVPKQFSPGPGTVIGRVSEALTNEPIENASVCYHSNCDLTDYNGDYSLSNIPTGSQMITVTKVPDFVSISSPVTVIDYQTVNLNFVLVRNLPGRIRQIVVTWSSTTLCWPNPQNPGQCWPNDLDAHLWVDFSPVLTQTWHIGYWGGGGHFAGDESCEALPYACLLLDNTDGSKPEIMQLNLDEAMDVGLNAIYYFGVRNIYQGLPGVPKLREMGVMVQLYDPAGLYRTYQIPQDNDENFWYVFYLDNKGASPTVMDANCVVDYYSAYNDYYPPTCPSPP
jgi:hypothetical protein